MPTLDVSDLLDDPDIAGDTFEVIRRIETVTQQGRTGITEVSQGMQVGAVYPTGSNSLSRQDAFQNGAKSISVVTTFRLRMAAQEGGVQFQPDIVVWEGDRYIVRELDDYSNYGAGFVRAGCTSIDFIDAPPALAPTLIGQMDFTQPGQSGLIGAL